LIKYFIGQRRTNARVKHALLCVTLCLALMPPPVMGDDELRSLELYNGAEAEIVSGSRSPRPASQTAENITVITSGEIEAFNAHTLADILNYITGVQMEMIRTPGSVTNIEVQGSNFNHVLVLVDDVPINNLSENFPDVSTIPVQMIERVEVVKGAASSAWGNALGGVVNVITKSPDTERALGGVVSGSFGQRETADGRVELTGTWERAGYYVTGGKLRSDGLRPNNMVDQENVYGKVRYDLPTRGSVGLTTGWTDVKSGIYGAGPETGSKDSNQMIATLSANYPITDRLSLDAVLLSSRTVSDLAQSRLFGGNLISATYHSNESRIGGNARLSWVDELQRISAGIDYEHVKAHVTVPVFRADLLDRQADRVGVYLSDTFTLGHFAVTPSARFDSNGSEGDHFSPSLGFTYAITENSLLRGYTARGYSLTSLNRDSSTEKVWTSQLGFETGEVPYLWLKGTLFRNDTWDVRALDPVGSPVQQRQLKQGVELEAKTLPFLNTSFWAGYTFMLTTLGDNGRVLEGYPRHTAKVGIRYLDAGRFQAELIGHYIDWNKSQTGKYPAPIWDLHLKKEFLYADNLALELFLSVRNLLDGDQYLYSIYQNAGRWGEAGVRCRF